MKISVQIEHNFFISLLTDSVKNYHLLLENEEHHPDFLETFAKGCIFNSNFALEAAANTFISMTDLSPKLSTKIERLSTIDKFDLALNLFQDMELPRGSSYVQEIQALIKIRNKLVHPKKYNQNLEVITRQGNDKIPQFHSPVKSQKKFRSLFLAFGSCESLEYNSNIAELGIKATINFLNWYVSDLWKVNSQILEEHILPYFKGIRDERPMHSVKEFRFLMKYQELFHIDFLDLESIYKQIQQHT